MVKHGFTTGSCAAAAAKAAAFMLLLGKEKTEITIETPKGILYRTSLWDIRRGEKKVSCAVQKDSGDDPDVTNGVLIYATVTYDGKDTEDVGIETAEERISITGGIGVGRVTAPGLNQPMGEAAINTVPREMIIKEVLQVCELADYKGRLQVEIFVPEGERLAEKTFNPRLGIVGGISILGTSGIVEPMSNQAILDTIQVELRQKKAFGHTYVAVTPGNYGQEFMKRAYGYNLDRSVKCSNFVGQTVDMAVELGFEKMLLTGHIGKLIKVAGGIMNTHSREADCRMELLAAFAAREGVETALLQKILNCFTTEETLRILKESGKLETVMAQVAEKVCYYLEMRTNHHIKIDCILYANEFGELAKSKGAEEWFTLLEQDAEQ